jgi:molecular chaperone DnaK (HSP70)
VLVYWHEKFFAASAGLSAKLIKDVVLVGGSTHIPALQQMICTIFEEVGNGAATQAIYNPNVTSDFQLHPNFAVVLGATMQSALMMSPAKARTPGSKKAMPASEEPPVSLSGLPHPHSAADDLAARSILDSLLLMDSLPTSYGIRTLGGVMVPVIRKGMPIPYCKSDTVTTNW